MAKKSAPVPASEADDIGIKCTDGKVPVVKQGTAGSRGIWTGDVGYCKRPPGEKKAGGRRGRRRKTEEE